MFHLTETLSAYQARDPAARSKLEVFLLYPGVHATMYHQAAHFCYCHKMKFLARTISQWSRFWTGIEIHPGAKIGRRLVIDHGMGIVGEKTNFVGDVDQVSVPDPVQKELDAINSRLSWLEEYLDKKHEEEENKRKENQQNEAV